MATAILEHEGRVTCDLQEATHARTMFEATVRFIDWADSQRHLTAQSAMDRFGLHRATAYRWVAAYRAARGIA